MRMIIAQKLLSLQFNINNHTIELIAHLKELIYIGGIKHRS